LEELITKHPLRPHTKKGESCDRLEVEIVHVCGGNKTAEGGSQEQNAKIRQERKGRFELRVIKSTRGKRDGKGAASLLASEPYEVSRLRDRGGGTSGRNGELGG